MKEYGKKWIYVSRPKEKHGTASGSCYRQKIMNVEDFVINFKLPSQPHFLMHTWKLF